MILAGICVCIFFLTTVQMGVAQQAELPTWDIGLTWAMGEPDFDLSFTYTTMGVTLDATGGGSYYVIYKVGAIEGQEYRVDLTGGLEIIMDIDISGDYFEQEVSGSMRMTMAVKVDGTIYYTRDELAVVRTSETVDLDIGFSGTVTAVGQTQSINGSMEASGNMSITFDPPLDILDFPITVGESWTAESVAAVTGSISGTMKMDSEEQDLSQPLDDTVYVSLSISCPGTVDIPLASTCYKIVVSGTGMAQASPFIPANVLYYSSNKGFFVAAELPFGEALSGASLGSEGSVPFVGDIAGSEEIITLSSVTEQEAQDALAGMGAKGINPILIGAIIAIVIVVIAAVLLVVRQRLA